MSAVFDALEVSALAIGSAAAGFAGLFGTFATGLSAIGLSESLPLILKFYRDAVRRACLPRVSALH